MLPLPEVNEYEVPLSLPSLPLLPPPFLPLPPFIPLSHIILSLVPPSTSYPSLSFHRDSTNPFLFLSCLLFFELISISKRSSNEFD
jgi:hypothetical protein